MSSSIDSFDSFDSFDFNPEILLQTPSDGVGLPALGTPYSQEADASYPLDVSEEQRSPSKKELEGFYRELNKGKRKRKRKGQANKVRRKKKYTDNQIKEILKENNIYYRKSASLDDGVHDPIVIIKERFGGNPYEYIKSLSSPEPVSKFERLLFNQGGKRRRKKRTKKRRTKKRSRKKKRKTLKKKRKRRKKKRKTRR